MTTDPRPILGPLIDNIMLDNADARDRVSSFYSVPLRPIKKDVT